MISEKSSDVAVSESSTRQWLNTMAKDVRSKDKESAIPSTATHNLSAIALIYLPAAFVIASFSSLSSTFFETDPYEKVGESQN